MIKERLNPGDLLVAPPKIRDERFEHSVIMLIHNDGYTLGFCLNKPTEHWASDIVPEIDWGEENIPLYWGGPMNPNTVWMLHSSEWQHESTVEINESWSMTSHIDMFAALAAGNRPQHYRLMYGCSNWAPGQLEGELEGIAPWTRSHSWLTVTEPNSDWLLEVDPDDLWNESTTLSAEQAIDRWIP